MRILSMIRQGYKNTISHLEDFFYYVPGYASAALTFYIIILIIPAASILALASNVLKINTTILQNLLNEFIMPQYAEMITNVLTSTHVSLQSIFILILSVFAVSRGIGNIYSISKKMFPIDEMVTENVIEYYVYTIKITIFLLLALIGFVFVFALGPIARVFDIFYGFLVLRYLVLFIMAVSFFTLLYKMIPMAKVRMREAYRGAIVTTLGLVILSIILTIYLSFANFSNVYGPLASIVIVLFILDWGCKVFYYGMYVVHLSYMNRYNKRVQDVTIQKINPQGLGEVMIYHKPCALRNVLMEEEVEIIVEKELPKQVKAVVSQIKKASPYRREAICPQADFCPYCQFQYMDYSQQVLFKKEKILRAINDYTQFKIENTETIEFTEATSLSHYKKEVNFPIFEYEDQIYIGYKNKNSLSFMDQCMLQDIEITEILMAIRELFNKHQCQMYHHRTKKGLREIILKKVEDKYLVTIVAGEDGLSSLLINDIRKIEEVSALFLSICTKRTIQYENTTLLFGEDKIIIHNRDYLYQYDLVDIMHSSPLQESDKILFSLIPPTHHVLSLYCGMGLLELGLPNPLIAIDENKNCIENARKNAQKYHLENKTFINGHINPRLPILLKENHFNCVILHLMDKPFTSIMSQTLYQSDIEELLMITSRPYGFAKDIFANDTQRIQSTYLLKKVYAIDSAPYTTHQHVIFHFHKKEGL